MKKFLISLIFFSSYLFGQTFSVSGSAGIDNYTIPAVKQNFSLNDGTPSYITRDEVANPFNAGLQLRFERNKVIFGIDADFTYKEYNIYYANYEIVPQLPPFSDNIDTLFSDSYTVPWVRAGINVFALYNLLNVNSLKINAGIGGGVQVVAPIVSDKFIEKTLKKKFEELDPTTDVNPEYLGNIKLTGEVLYAISRVIAIGVEGNYLFLSKGENDQPQNFAQVKTKFIISF